MSVVVPFLNGERFIKEAIESVFAQTYSHWELLLVDDGSSDSSTQIAVQCAQQDPEKVRYLDHHGHQNRGVCASRNLGIRQARGELIALLDADDVWLAEKLGRQVAILSAHPEAAMVYGPSQYWYSWPGNSQEDRQRDFMPRLGVEPNTLIRPPTLLTLALESKAPTPCPSNILLRRKIVEMVGGFEESFHGIHQLYEDQVFLAKLYLKVPVFVASECWDRYRQHPDSCVSVVTRAGQKYETGLSYLRWLEDYLLAERIKDPEVWKALEKKRRRYRFPRLSPLLERAQHHLERIKRWVPFAARRGSRRTDR